MAFTAKFMKKRSGISSKTGAPWYRVQLLCDTISGGVAVGEFWVSANVFDAVSSLPNMAPVKVLAGVDDEGRLTLKGVQKDG